MIETFDDFCLWIYVLVDEVWREMQGGYKHRRQAPLCRDGELLSMILISECVGWDVETEALQHWQAHRDLFPFIPSQSRYNRRRRALSDALKVIRQTLIQRLDVAQDAYCAVRQLAHCRRPIPPCTASQP